ncbi:MAG: tyrosine-type recombinase/integrase [Bacteroidales bacterium]|nr:tyrosine-type recombinase/integrase [Bacteroidales bacterium]
MIEIAKLKYQDIEENITTYWARHTFSTVSLLEGAPLEYISQQLTHQNIITTTTYIDSFKDDYRKEYSQKLLVD